MLIIYLGGRVTTTIPMQNHQILIILKKQILKHSKVKEIIILDIILIAEVYILNLKISF